MNGEQHHTCTIFSVVCLYIFLVSSGASGDVLIGILITGVVAGFLADLPDYDHPRKREHRRMMSLLTFIKIGLLALIGIQVVSIIYFICNDISIISRSIYLIITIIALGALQILTTGQLGGGAKSSSAKFITKHRGLSHTLFYPVIMSLGIIFTCNNIEWNLLRFIIKYAGIGVVFAYMTHILADMYSVNGAPILWPMTEKPVRFTTLSATKYGWLLVGLYFITNIVILLILLKL